MEKVICVRKKCTIALLSAMLIPAVLAACSELPEDYATPREPTPTQSITQEAEPLKTKKIPAALSESAPVAEGFHAADLICDGNIIDYAYVNELGIYIDPVEVLARCGFDGATRRLENDILKLKSDDGLELTTEKNTHYLCLNGRYFYSETEFIVVDGRVFIPSEVLTRGLNVKLTTDAAVKRIELDTEKAELFECGEEYYDVNCSGDDIYWMTHIIEAEAGNQNIECMIGVANVVNNRAAAEGFPNTVYDVIFDYQGSAQFSPKMSTALSRNVSQKAKIAAYLAIEGYVMAENCLYFQNPDIIDTNWIAEAREFALRLDEMDFYY